ncbi:MAG: GH92 family glycosyl hydrolase [candidate division KSB1 bacterium]|nr:GH92 family glycosyl hydrolase [candidate division KSB1 bacterium]
MSIKTFILIFLLPVLTLHAGKPPVDQVNVFTGTSNSRWMLFPGSCMPFGLVKLSPDNQENVWNGGYEYTVGSISGFSHLHGMSLSGVSYMPVSGNLEFGEEYSKLFPGQADGPFGHMWTAGYRSRYKKESETGFPGYYSVHLLDYDITVELTATLRCGMIRATYPQGKTAQLLLNLDIPAEELNEIRATHVTRNSETEIEGFIEQSNQYADDYAVYFVSRFSEPVASMDAWQYQPYSGDNVKYGTAWRRPYHIEKDVQSFTSAANSGVILNFPGKEAKTVTIQTGISFVSIKNARLNLNEEMHGDFDTAVQQARQAWNDLLSRVKVQGGTQDDRVKFYTNLYRSFTGKNILSDVNGEYRDMCEKIRTIKAPADAVYSGDGFWGAQWTLIPLWTLIAPEYANSISHSFLELYDAGGWIPEAPTALEYAPIMGAQHHNALLISSFQKGIAEFDAEKAYRAIKHDYITPGIEHPCGGFAGNRHLAPYMEYGYVPEEYGPVSNTLEYAYDDWCLAQFAKALNKAKDVKTFTERSMNYQNVYDEQTGYMRRRHADGRWVQDFDPFRMGTEGGWNGPGYMEGNAWLYTWFVPHDLKGLIDLLGLEEFNRRLETGFEHGYVDLSNQPNLQAPFLFNYSGKPWLTQKYSRHVVDDLFNTSPYSGWVGEEDEGQMGSLCALLSMGLFEMKGGCSVEPYYDLSSPMFEKIILNLHETYYSGNTFTIIAHNNSKTNRYIQSAELNGKTLKQPILLHRDIAAGGTLELQMGPEPDKN